jgi:Pyruvate/2-oxoacid:ferredoxin oxidoreductase delta subunit
MKREDGTGRSGQPAEADRLRAVADIVAAPDFVCMHLDSFYEPADLTLLEALAGGERPIVDLAAERPGVTTEGLRRAHRRAVVTLSSDATKVAAASFSDRFEAWIVFEGWKDLPTSVRERLAAWDLDKFVEEIRGPVAQMTAGRRPEEVTGNDTFILLDEAEAIVRGAKRVFVRPCSCRRIAQSCDKPVDVCLWIDEDERDQGWEISRERGVEILLEADRAGLMRTANDADTAVATWICCCCPDCCYPLLAGERLGAADVYPARRYLALLDDDACTRCGICVRRCPFAAWSLQGTGEDRVLRLQERECRGCGVCATGCPESAIAMVKRQAVSGTPRQSLHVREST